jgi:hypothetical protein
MKLPGLFRKFENNCCMQRTTETSEMPRDVDTIPFCRLFGATSIRPQPMCPQRKALRRCFPWTMRPLKNAPLERCVPVRSIPYWRRVCYGTVRWNRLGRDSETAGGRELIVQGTHRLRTFIRGHFGQGHIVIASSPI